MPRIPITQAPGFQTPNVSVAGVDFASVGASGKALANIGESMANLGVELADRRAKAEANDFARTQREEFESDARREFERLKMSRADDGNVYFDPSGNRLSREDAQARQLPGRTVQQSLMDFMQKNQKQRMRYAPNQLGSQAFSTASNSIINEIDLNAFSEHGKFLLDTTRNKELLRNETLGKTIVSNPDPIRGFNNLLELETERNQLIDVLGQQEIDGLNLRARKQYSESMFAGMANKISAVTDVQAKERLVNDALGILNGTKKAATAEEQQALDAMVSGLSADQKAQLLANFQREKTVVGQIRVGDVNNRMDDLRVRALNAPETIDQDTIAGLSGMINSMPGSAEGKARLKQEISSIVAAGAEIRANKFQSPTEWQPLPTATDAIVANKNKIIQDYRQEILRQREKPGDYVATQIPSVGNLAQAAEVWSAESFSPDILKNTADTLVSQQLNVGFFKSQTQVSTSGIRQSFAQEWQSLGDVGKAQLLERARAGYGEHFRSFIKELRLDKDIKISDQLEVASWIPDGPGGAELRAAIIRNTNPEFVKQTKEAFLTSAAGKREGALGTLEQGVDKELTAFKLAVAGANPSNISMVNAFRDAIVTEVMTSTLNASTVTYEHVQAAKAKLLDAHFDIIEGSNARFGLAVSKQDPKMADMLGRFLSSNKDATIFNRINDLEVSETFKQKARVVNKDLSDSEISKMYHFAVKEHATWIQSENGVALAMQDEVDDKRFYLIMGKNKQPIMLSHNDIRQLDAKGELATSTSFIGRSFDLIFGAEGGVVKAQEFVREKAKDAFPIEKKILDSARQGED